MIRMGDSCSLVFVGGIMFCIVLFVVYFLFRFRGFSFGEVFLCFFYMVIFYGRSMV